MKILLRKIGKIASEFEVKSDEITFKGYLQYDTNRLILLRAKLSGNLQTRCDICAKDFILEVDEDIKLFISDGIYKSDSEELLDIIEVYDSMVDLEDILKSEVELIKSDYHICPECSKAQKEFEFTLE